MNYIAGICIVGIITLGIYRLFELYARRKERIMLIEKLGNSVDQSEIRNILKFPFFTKPDNSFWALKISLLLIGIGLGVIISFFIQYALQEGLAGIFNYYETKETIYFSCIAIFGGVGLLIAYLIERKDSKRDNQ